VPCQPDFTLIAIIAANRIAPILNANDFQCFLNAYAVGCN
jgi:hypothetical protein